MSRTQAGREVEAQIAAAVREATRSIPDHYRPGWDLPAGVEVVRIRYFVPDREYAHSQVVGAYEPDDAGWVAERLATLLGGRATKDGAWYVAVGQRPKLLSMREVAERARSRGKQLAESSVRAYRSAGRMPDPDVLVGSAPGWLAETIDPWIDALPGRGANLRSTG